MSVTRKPGYRASRGCAAALAVVATALPAAVQDARAAPTESPRSFQAEYVISWVGLPVYRARFSARIGAGGYSSVFTARSLGLVELAARTRVSIRTEGRIAGDGFRPERVKQTYRLRNGKFRHVDMTYGRDGRVATTIRPPESPGKRPPVPAALTRHTRDPISALLDAVTKPLSAPPCVYAASVFEGRRRVDTRLTHAGPSTTPYLRVEGLPEEAEMCMMKADRIAGFRDKHFRKMPKLPPARLWVVRHRGTGLWLPVQLRLETRWGAIYAKLVRFEAGGAGATR